jgi:hypothetical protein
VESFQDHRQPRFAMEEAVRWRWVDEEARDADEKVRAGLRALAEEDAG